MPNAAASTKLCSYDKNESIAEGSGENLFVVKDGRVLTNDSRHSILMGVTRDSDTAIGP